MDQYRPETLHPTALPAPDTQEMRSVWRSPAALALALAASLALQGSADAAGKRKGRAKRRAAKAPAAKVAPEPAVLPVDVGVGPVALLLFGPVADDQTPHYGLKVSVQAIVDQALIRRYRSKIPNKFRGWASRVEEARISPSIFIPDTLILSPKLERTGIYGATWRPLGLTLPLIRRPFRFDLSPGLILTYAFLHSDAPELASRMHFFRPGLDAKAELEVPLSDSFLVSLGWTSQLHVPQVIGGGFFEVKPAERSIWHVGQAFLKLHLRVPYRLP